jgi:ATP-dependent protease HslVU (ClpYQ) peptidase subunit
MTCIVGILDRENDCVFIGSDSMISGYSNTLLNVPKIIKIPNTDGQGLLAITGVAKIIQVIETNNNLIDRLTFMDNKVDKRYLTRTFVPNLFKDLYENACAIKKDDAIYIMGSMIFGFKNKLYGIHQDGFLIEPDEDYIAMGSGQPYAYGSLETTKGENPLDRIHKALLVGEKFADGVRKPFYILNTKTNDFIKID